MRYEFRNDGTLIPQRGQHTEVARFFEAPRQNMIQPYRPPRPNAIHETPAFYWIMTLVLAAGTGLICGFLLLTLIVQAIGIEEVSETEMLVGSILIPVGFIAGTIIYNIKCYQNGRGFFKINNYLLSMLTSLGIGAAIIPAVMIVIFIVTLILSILLVILGVAILIGIVSSW